MSEETIKTKIKLNEETISLFERTASVLIDNDTDKYYFIPFWFKRIGDTNEFEMHALGKLPKKLKEFIILKRNG
jgi:hypothetical protein